MTIKIDAICKNSKGFYGAEYEFEVKRSNSGYISADIDKVKETLETNSECVFYNPGQLDDFIRINPEHFDFAPGKLTLSNPGNNAFELRIDGNIPINSLTSNLEWLTSWLDLKECVTILNKINKMGLVSFVETYVELRESELTALQSLSEVSEQISKKMAALIQHIAALKQWLFLNE